MNCLLEARPLVLQASLCTIWHCCEWLHWLQWTFLKTISRHLPISWWVIYKCTCPHHTECSAVFEQRWHDPVPHLPDSPTLTPRDYFLFLWMKKFCKSKYFIDKEEVKHKMAEVLKGIKIDKFKNCFEQWKNISIGVLHQIESTLNMTEV